MKKIIFLNTLAIIAFLYSAAQTKIDFKGIIVDQSSNPISDVSIYFLNSDYAATSNNTGRFEIKNVLAGTYVVNISKVGYATINKEMVISGQTSDVTIALQPSYKQLDEVTVINEKYEGLQQQLPLSVTNLSSKAIEDYRVWNVNDLTALAPNLYTADPGDKRNVTSIRGIVTTSYDPAVAVYIDGVNQFGLDTYITELFDLDKVEIVRGPQGTLYGRNAMGGVINIITRRPLKRTSGFAEASIGNYGLQRYTAGIRTDLIKDKLLFGAAGLYEKNNGFYTNEFNNSDYDKQHSGSGNYYLKYIANEKWNVNLNFKHTSNRNNGPFPLVFGVEDALNNPFKLNQNALTTMVDNILNGSASVNYNGNNFNFNAQSSYQSNYRFYKTPIDADFSPLDALTINNNYGKDWNNVKVFTQEVKFSSPASVTGPLKWTAGSYYFHQNSPVKQATVFGEDAEMLGAPEKNFSLINTTTAKSSGIAFYGQATYSINDKIDLTGGLRYDHEQKEQSILGQYQKDPDPNPIFDYRSDTSAKANFSAFSPKLNIAYHLTPNNTAFIGYSKGFRAGGLTPLSQDPSQPALFKFKPEFSSNVEAGLKNTFFDKKLVLNATVFFTKVYDVQVPTLVLPDAVTIIRNTGELSSKGAELEVSALIVKGLELNYNFGYTNAKYKNLKVAQNSTEVNLEGKRQLFTPDVTSLLALQYNVVIGNNVNLFVRGESKYLGKQYFDLNNTIAQDGYMLFNTRAGVAVKNVTVSLWGRNLTDKKHIQYGYDFGAVHLGNPRTYGATVNFKM